MDSQQTLTGANGCYRSDGASFDMAVELRKDQFGPDKSYGSKNFNACVYGTGSGNWGNPGGGSFFDQIHTYNFGTVSANAFNVRY